MTDRATRAAGAPATVWWRRTRAAAAGTGVTLALLAGALVAPAAAAPADTPVDCPAAVPKAQVAAGMVGQGWTVVTGTTPQPFQVEVLGVLADGIGAGRDMVIIKVSDLPDRHVVDQGGGIWAGMSGSPVYVDGKLLGSVSYGFTASPSPIGGLTPATDLYDLLKLGARAAAPATAAAASVALPTGLRQQVAAKAGTAVPHGTLQPLVTPLGVSGLGPSRVNQLQDDADAAGWKVKAYAAGGASTSAATSSARPAAGGNFSAAMSYGDVAMYGTGTTTAVCGNEALAFGHPMNLAGPSRYGANLASSIAIIKDDAFGSYKMANLGARVGTVDQDRTGGIRADLSRQPAGTPVTTTIRNADTGKKRTGTTSVLDQQYLAGLVPYAVVANSDAVFDEIGDGTATSDWTIRGTRAGGRSFTLHRANSFASQDDVTLDPAFDLANAVAEVVGNTSEDVTVTSVTYSSTMATTFRQLHISKLAVSVNGGKFTSPKNLKVKAGAKLRLRVSLQPYRRTTTSTTTLALTVPKSAKGKTGVLTAVGGLTLASSGSEDVADGCLLEGDCGTEDSSLATVIRNLTSAPRNDAVVGQLTLASDSATPKPAASTAKVQALTVTGTKNITVSVR